MDLESSVSTLKYINDKYLGLLNLLGIYTVKDLLVYFPRKYIDSTNISTIQDINLHPQAQEHYVIKVKIKSFKNTYIKRNMSIQVAEVEDETGILKPKWFNQTYLSRVLKVGKTFLLRGKVKLKTRTFDFFPTDFEEIKEETTKTRHLGGIIPEYALTKGISKKWLRNRISEVLDVILNNSSIHIKNELNSSDLRTAIKDIHFPQNEKKLAISVKLLSELELTNLQLQLEEIRQKNTLLKRPVLKISEFKDEIDSFLHSLPFELTKDQKRVITALNAKLQKNERINNLLQGDVGSGKTIISVYLTLLNFLNGFQTVLLAPTTILAKQHYETFTQILNPFKVGVELVIGSNKKAEKNDVLIGTSAVLARKSALIENLGFLIIDEQHRFGVKQRKELVERIKKDSPMYPHVLNMSATPIPRTIAETFFGDLEVNTIKTKPSGRLPVATKVVSEEKRENMYEWINQKVTVENEQVYWISPLVEESENLELKSAVELQKKLQKSFKKLHVGLLHGKMKSVDKQKIMKQYAENKIHILVSTTVIEVGIDVENATVLVIENADRFGLAQLHQLRGRVGRNDKQSWCFLFKSKEVSDLANTRLDFFTKENDGLKIAEFDLQTRGPGEVYGTKQSGIPNLKIAKFNDIELIKKSRLHADKLYKKGIKSIYLFS